ncbi:MAG TPA: alkaline phosphatase family protein [Rhizomicrobium sp.]|nr:alkaline phosphatase family protein [Rhizomicrobium sp.]
MGRNRLGAALGALLAAATFLLAPVAAEETAAPPAKHHIKTVFIILMENHNWTGRGAAKSIKGNVNAPYINDTLIPMSSYADRYYNPPNIHPSLPNYLWLEAGTNFKIYNDGPPRRNGQTTTEHFVTQLSNAGISWKAYLENAPGKICPLRNSGPKDPDKTPLYAVRHEPFTYFADVTNNLDWHSSTCIAHLRPYRELAADLRNDTVPQYVWITPNMCDDMHDACAGNAIAHGDAWLSKNVPVILHSAAYKRGGALFITWDEAAKGDGPIPMIVLSPFAKGGGYSNTVHYTHGSTLRTFQNIFGVRPLLRDAKDEIDLSDLFSVFP